MVVKLKLLWATLLRKRAGKFKNKFDQDRLEANRELVEILTNLVEEQPTQRFSQLLRNAGFIKENRPAKPDNPNIYWQNEFYMEPQDVLKRVKRRLNNE